MGHITVRSAGNRLLGLAAALACAAALGGCGGVELEGKVFDYAGLSGSRQKVDPTMSSRAPLMVPPNLQKLPSRTESRSFAATRQDWPDDPEKVRVRVVEEQKAAEAEVAKKDDPLNAYAGKETLLDKLFKRKETVEEPVADVPEPDEYGGSQGTAVATSQQPITPHVNEAPLPDQNTGAFKPAAPNSYNSVTSGRNRAF